MMASKPKKTPAPKAQKLPRKTVQLKLKNGDRDVAMARKVAALATSPELAAYRALNAVEAKSGISEQIDVPALLDQLRDQAAAANRGDLAQAEAMLMNQATALQSLFVRLVECGMTQDIMPNIEGFMRLALRAQSQCRATLETLASIKNPPIIYAKQANVTSGPQQINNGIAAPSQARDIKSEQTQLSGGNHELLQDARTSGKASRANPALETLGEIDRAEVHRR